MRNALAAAVACAGFACIIQRGQNPSVGNRGLDALVFAGTAVGGAAINRNVTGECWASCPAGYACDRKSGVCEKLQCNCPADLVCERAGSETVCVQPRAKRERPIDDAGADASDAADAAVASDAATD
jgi:hypothetical protein